MEISHQEIVEFIKSLYKTNNFIPLHEPKFIGNERQYVLEALDSTFVSSLGKYVDRFESMVSDYTGAKYAVATVNGTSALHLALKLVNVKSGDEVITQPLSFVATCNAIAYCNAKPIFVDVDVDSMGMSPLSLNNFLKENTFRNSSGCINKSTGRRIAAVVPMHTFGLPCRIDEIQKICREFNIPLVEDAAESLGSYYGGKHTGTFGDVGILSFNGNKTITTGGGGMILTDNPDLARRAKHISTTAKVPHRYEFIHDEVGYNYRLPNINAALGCAQMETLNFQLESKRKIANSYQNFFSFTDIKYVTEIKGGYSNYWLNSILLKDHKNRDLLLNQLNDSGIMSRPIWTLVCKLKMFRECQRGNLENSFWLEERIINLPSSSLLA